MPLQFQPSQNCAVKHKKLTSDGTSFIHKDLAMSAAAYLKHVFFFSLKNTKANTVEQL